MKRFLKLLAVAAVMAAMCFAFAACGEDSDCEIDAEDNYEYQVQDMESGTAIGTFTSSDLNGTEMTEAVFTDKDVTVLNVWGTYCGPCKEEMPELAAWDAELPDNVQIIGMVVDVPEGDDDMIKTAKKICKGTNVKYTNIVMTDSVEELLERVEAIPTTFILDSEGKTVCTPIVGADVPSYKNAVEDYLDQLN